MPDTPPTPGEIVAALRKAKGWNAYQLASKADIPAATVYRLESGERTPGIDVLRRICVALGVSLAVFDSPQDQS